MKSTGLYYKNQNNSEQVVLLQQSTLNVTKKLLKY